MTFKRKFTLSQRAISILLGIVCVVGLSSCHDTEEEEKAPAPVVQDKNKKGDSKKSKAKAEPIVQAAKKIPDLEPALKPPPQGSDNRILNFPGLPRVVQVSPTIITGYEPLGAPGFESLKKLGVKTIVTVDGAQPDVEKAKEFGMHYIHIPFGYDGIPNQSILSIYKVAKETEGPIYFHCHHGRHRGPSAAAVALEVQTGCSGLEALKVLEVCGTSKDYQGLWQSVENFKTPAATTVLPELKERAAVSTLADAMAKLDRHWDQLVLLSKTNWVVPKEHEYLSSEHEALILGESFRTAARLFDRDKNDDLWLRLKEQEAQSFKLMGALKEKNFESATKLFTSVKQNCTTCHTLYRDPTKHSPEIKKGSETMK